MKLISFITLLAIAMVQLPASLAFHLMNSGQSSEIEHHLLMTQRRMDRVATLKKDCFSECRAQLLNRNDDICKAAWNASGSDTHRSCLKGRSRAYHATCLDRCQSVEAMASPVEKASSFEACKHFQNGPLRAWCFEGFASVYNAVNASLKQSKVAAEAELAIQAAEELIFESEAGAEEDLDGEQAVEVVESGGVDGQVDGDQAVDAIVKDEGDVQVHAAVGENVVVIGVDAQVDARVDANRAAAELKPGNSTNEPPRTEDSSMLWQLEHNVIFSGAGVEAKAVEAVGEQLKLETIMDTLKSEPNFLMLIGSNFDYSRSHDLETNHEVNSYERDAHTSNKTATASVLDSPFRDKHNRSKLPSRVPAPIHSGVDLNLNTDSNIVVSIDRGGSFQSNRCHEVEEVNIGLMDWDKDLSRKQTTCFEEDTRIIITDDDGSSDSCFAPFSELIGYQDTGMNPIISSHPCVDRFDKRFKHLPMQSRYNTSPVEDLKLCALALSSPPMHLSTIDRRVMYDYDVGQDDPNSSAAFCTGAQAWNSDRFGLQYIQAQCCRSLRSQLNCFVDPAVLESSSLYFQVCFKMKAKYDEDVSEKRFRLGGVPEQASQWRWMVSSGTTKIASLSRGVTSSEHIIHPSASTNCLFRHTLSSATLFKAQDIQRDCKLIQLFVVGSIDVLSNDTQLVAVTSNMSSRVELVLDYHFSQSCSNYMMNVCDKTMDLCTTCWVHRLKQIDAERGKPLPTEVSTSIFFDTSWPIFIPDERMMMPHLDIWKCLLKQPSDRGPFCEPAIGSLTVWREYSPCVVLGIEVILLLLAIAALLCFQSYYVVSNSSFCCSCSFIVHSLISQDCRMLSCRLLESRMSRISCRKFV